jgi:hypothetical protein
MEGKWMANKHGKSPCVQRGQGILKERIGGGTVQAGVVREVKIYKHQEEVG